MKNIILSIFLMCFLISCSNGDSHLVCNCYTEQEFIEGELVNYECADYPASGVFKKQSLSFNERKNTIKWANYYEHFVAKKTNSYEAETSLDFTNNEIVFKQTTRYTINDGQLRLIEGFREVRLNRISLLLTEELWGDVKPYKRLFNCSVTEAV